MALAWDYLRDLFVSGDDDVTLKFLSEQAGAPAYQSLRNRASKEKWAEQRREYRASQVEGIVTAPPPKPSTADRDSPESRRAISAAAEKVIRFSKMLDERARLAHQLMTTAANQALKRSPESWTVKECAQFYQIGAKVHQDSINAAIQLIDLGIFTREELQAIAEGTDRKTETIEIT